MNSIVMAHPIPTDLEVVKVLAAAPAALDPYVWLSYRCFTAKGEESVRIFGPFGLVRQIGSVEYSCERKFRAKFGQWLRTIRAIWRGCPARIADDGRYRIVGRGTPILRDAALAEFLFTATPPEPEVSPGSMTSHTTAIAF